MGDRITVSFGPLEVATSVGGDSQELLLRVKSSDGIWTFDAFMPREQALQLVANIMTAYGVTTADGEG